MKIKRNRKADANAVAIVGGVIIILVIGAVAIAFSGGVAAVGTGVISKGQCKTTVELKNRQNDVVDYYANQAKGPAGFLAGTVGALAGFIFGFGSPIGMFGGGFIGEWVGHRIVDEVAGMAKIETDLCMENFPDECPITLGKTATADLTAECAYRRLVDTFYTLQGGRGIGHEKRMIDGRKFNLYKLNVTVEDPGSILLVGSCSNYLTQQAIWTQAELQSAAMKDCSAVVASGRDYVCGFDEIGGNRTRARTQTGGVCNVTFSKVTEPTMTLTMISRCQEYGPDQQRYCKCFASTDAGYQTSNGLPNSRIGNYLKDGKFTSPETSASYTTLLDGTYHPEYSQYRGCGAAPLIPLINPLGARINNDNIWAEDLNVKMGEEKTYYLRLEDNGQGNGMAYIRTNEQ